MSTEITLTDGKYTVIHEDGKGLRALRYGEPWRDLTGDGLVLTMAYRVEELEQCQKAMLNLEKLVEQFLPNIGQCGGIDMGLLNDTLIECAKIRKELGV